MVRKWIKPSESKSGSERSTPIKRPYRTGTTSNPNAFANGILCHCRGNCWLSCFKHEQRTIRTLRVLRVCRAPDRRNTAGCKTKHVHFLLRYGTVTPMRTTVQICRIVRRAALLSSSSATLSMYGAFLPRRVLKEPTQ